MKKTITTALLCLGLATAASAATLEESGLELGSVTYTTVTGLSSGNGYGSSIQSFTFNLNADLFTGTQDTTNALTTASDQSVSYASDKVALTELTLVGKGTAAPGANRLQILDSKDNVIVTTASGKYFSTPSATLTDVFDGTEYTLGTRRWIFDNVVLTVGETYTVKLLNANGGTNSTGLTTSYADGTSAGAYVFTTGGHEHQPGGMTIVTKSTVPVPEPATATLSLLALAGFAARRRR